MLVIPTHGIANDGPIRLMGGSASPKSSHPSVRMDSEEVTIPLHKNSYSVDAVFHFFNTGEAVTELVGFPKRAEGMEGSWRMENFIRFETWVNDERAPFTEEPRLFRDARLFLSGVFSNVVRDYRWLVKQVTFPGNAKTTTRVSYEASYTPFEHWAAFYVYGTGSFWKGNIGKGTFTIDGNNVVAARHFDVRCDPKLASTRAVVSEYVVQYELTNFKPSPEATLAVWFDPTLRNKSVDKEKEAASKK